MGKPIEIGIASETKAFKQGVDAGIIRPLEDAEDALDDLGKSRGTDQLERGLEDAQDATKRLEKDVKGAADSIDREFKGSYGKMKSSSGDGTSAAKRDLAELGNEARQNASEVFSSFDGSATSFADGIQGTLGGIVSSLGPIGAAAGAAGALGIGLIMGSMEDGKEEAEEFRARVAELTQELIDVDGEGGPSIDYLVDRLRELATSTEDGAVNLAELRRVADGAKFDYKALAQAYAGNTDELDKMLASGKDYLKQLDDELTRTDTATNAGGRRSAALTGQVNAQREVIDLLEEAKTVTDAAAQEEANYLAAGGAEWDAKKARIEAINNAYDDAASSVDDYVNAETGIFDVGAYITAMQEREQAIRDYQDTLATSPLSAEARAFLEEQGIEAAGQFLAGYKSASPAQQAELNRIWSEAGRANSGAYLSEVSALAGHRVTGPRIDVPSLDLSRVEREIQNFVLKPRQTVITTYFRPGARTY